MKKTTILYFIILVLIPVFIISVYYEPINKKAVKNISIKIKKDNDIKKLDLEEYIIGVVAGEMPASFEKEALKAQAIASRTYAVYKIENFDNKYDVESTTDDQKYISIEEMKEKWEEEFDKYYNKIKIAVEETQGLVMKKNNKIFKSYYFSMSNGKTADSITVFKDNISASVESPWDNENLKNFEVTKEVTKEEIKKALNLNENIENIEITSRDNTDRVLTIEINKKEYEGTEFRKSLSLRSTDFIIKEELNSYLITTKGYGHGVGMSQYGANGMAKEKYTYKEILKYYYQNIEITAI